MKTIFTLVLATLFTTFSFAQKNTCDCKTDLDFLVKKMKKTPSYKHQIKNKKEAEFNQLYTTLAAQMTAPISVEACFKLLSQQMSSVKDFHASVVMNQGFFSEDDIENTEKIAEFKNSAYYKGLPRIATNLDSLRNDLSKKPATSFEGIYNRTDKLVIGISKTKGENEYAGVVLESNISTWEVGQIHFYATMNEDGKYDFYNYELYTYRPRYVMNLTFENGRVWSFKKTGNDSNHELYSSKEANWTFKDLNDAVQYIRIAHFSGSNANRKAQKKFYKEMESNLTAPNLILDLRSNGGGSHEVSDPFLKLFKEKGIAVYVITNAFTASNAEQFTTKILQIKNTTHLGQTTFGIIAYGSDKKWPTAPSGNYTFRTMDMDFHKTFFEYEGKGITPSIPLNFKTDWVEQTLTIISNKKQS